MFGKNVGFACHILNRCELCSNRSETAFFGAWFQLRTFLIAGENFMNKKIIAILLLITMFLSMLVGCGSSKDDGFKDVASITYTVDGKKKTEKSVARMYVGKAEPISEDEYLLANPKYQVTSVGISQTLTASSKTVASVCGFDDSDKGNFIYYKYVAWGSMGFGRVRGKDFDYGFSKYEIKSGIFYSYVRVKVVDDDTIIIKNSSGETTYNVSSYSITYFN